MRPVLLCLVAIAAWSADSVTGYRGDRNGSYPGCNPPIVWDEATGKNLAWKTELPNWCYGSPIVVGQKVFVMSEAGWKSDFPQLTCLDLASGKILWSREINHLQVAIPAAKRREQIAAAWHSLLERMRTAFTLVDESWSADPADAAKITDIGRRAEALGGKLEDKWGRKQIFGNQHSAGGYGVLRGWGAGKQPGPGPELGVSQRDIFNETGLRLETFYGFGTAREGSAFPTPASDGKAVYVVTDHGAHACFDLDGKQKWLTWFKPDHRGTGGHDDSLCRSPVVVDGLFITDLHMDNENTRKKPQNTKRLNPVYALDTATGKVVWEVPLPMDGSREHGCGSSKVMDVGGVRIFITTGGHVLRVKDGAPLLTCAHSAQEPCNGQAEVATDDSTDTLFYFPSGGQKSKSQLVAVRLAMEGGKLTEKELWQAAVKVTGVTMAVHEGKIYTGGDVVDSATGAVTSWGNRLTTRWLVSVAAGRLYSLKSDGVATVFDLSGKQLAVNQVVTETSDPELIARHLAISGNRQLDFSYSAAFTIAGDRLLMRSYDHLYCFKEGASAKGGRGR